MIWVCSCKLVSFLPCFQNLERIILVMIIPKVLFSGNLLPEVLKTFCLLCERLVRRPRLLHSMESLRH